MEKRSKKRRRSEGVRTTRPADPIFLCVFLCECVCVSLQ